MSEKSGLHIRKAMAEDIPRIVQIENESFSLPWSERDFNIALKEDYQIFLAAEENGQVEGYAVMFRIAGEAQLANIACSKGSRRSGIASRLLELAIGEVKKDCECIFLEVRESNHAARSLYEKYGFSPFAVRKGYYDSPKEDAIVMRRLL